MEPRGGGPAGEPANVDSINQQSGLRRSLLPDHFGGQSVGQNGARVGLRTL